MALPLDFHDVCRLARLDKQVDLQPLPIILSLPFRCAFFIRYGGKDWDALKVKRNDSNSFSRPTNISRLF